MNMKIIPIAIVAGIACALAILASITMGAPGMLLLLAGPFPIYVATLAWGTHAGVASSIMAIIVASTLISPPAAIIVGLLFSIPASIIGHQANLAQQEEDGSMEWYPLPRLLFNLCIVLIIGLVAAGFFLGFNEQDVLPQMSEALRQLLSQNPPPVPMTDAEIDNAAKTFFSVLPFVFSGFWLAAHAINLHLAAATCRMSGLMPRPRDDIAETISLPRIAVAALLFGLLGSVVTAGPLQHIAGAIGGTFIMGFAFVGLGMLHRFARGNATGVVLLVASYVLIILFYFPLILFAMMGISRVMSNASNTPPNSGTNNT